MNTTSAENDVGQRAGAGRGADLGLHVVRRDDRQVDLVLVRRVVGRDELWAWVWVAARVHIVMWLPSSVPAETALLGAGEPAGAEDGTTVLPVGAAVGHRGGRRRAASDERDYGQCRQGGHPQAVPHSMLLSVIEPASEGPGRPFAVRLPPLGRPTLPRAILCIQSFSQHSRHGLAARACSCNRMRAYVTLVSFQRHPDRPPTEDQPACHPRSSRPPPGVKPTPVGNSRPLSAGARRRRADRRLLVDRLR